MKRILVIEDDESISSPLLAFLQHHEFDCALLDSAINAIERIKRFAPDLIVLDRMLPGGDGLDICKSVRQFSDVPIILLTAKNEEIDRLMGLESGADDYLAKPFSAPELVLRIKAILRRSTKDIDSKSESVVYLDESNNCLVIKDKTQEQHRIALTPVECNLVRLFLNAPNKVLHRETLKTQVYKDHRVVSERTIDSHVSKLRKKIDHFAEQVKELSVNISIQSVYGTGYRFELVNCQD